MAAKDYQARVTLNPTAQISYDTGAPVKLGEDDWKALSNDLNQTYIAALAQTADIRANAEKAREIYEMATPAEVNEPWADASNVDVPLVPTLVDTMVAQITAMALPPRLIIVTGKTPEATKNAPLVERYLNDQLVEQRGHTTWYNELVKWFECGAQQGNGYVAATWREEKRRNRVRVEVPETDPDNPDTPIIDPDTMEPMTRTEFHEVEETLYDDVDLHSVQLRDYLIVPPTARTLEAAVASFETLWLMEDDLRKLVRSAGNPDGPLDADEVEEALIYAQVGNDEVSSDRQGYQDKSAGGQVTSGIGQGSLTSRFFKNRGPLKVELVLTKQYDMNDDGLVEWNWMWYHDLNQRMLGWCPYEYMVPGLSDSSKPYFSFCPLPRVQEHYGFMLPIRLAPIRVEINHVHNATNNLLTLAQKPPEEVVEDMIVDDNEQQWGPGFRRSVSALNASRFLEVPQPPIEAFQKEAQLVQYAQAYVGITPQATGTQGGGKRTATDTKAATAGNSVRANLLAMRFRIEIRALFNFILKMKVQYQKEDGHITIHGEQFDVPKEILGLPYRVDVVGASDPADAATRRQEVLGLYQLLMQTNPIVQQSPSKIYALSRMLLEAFNEGDVTELIGTEQEAQQLEEMKKQMQAAQAQMMQQGQMPPQAGQNGKPQAKPQGAPAM